MTEPVGEYKGDEKMERVKVRIAGDADSGYVFVSMVPAKAKRTAIYIGPEKSIWLLDQEKALEVIREYGEQCMSSLMGKSDYIIIVSFCT